MECISTHPYAPIIVQPESGHDWAQQHILGEQLRLGQAKQSPPSLRVDNGVPMKQWATRQSTSHRAVLQIPDSQLRVPKPTQPLKTPTKTNERSKEEWEDMLKTSMATLQGAYSRMEVPPAPRSRSLGDRLHKPSVAGLDRTEIASRALQVAAGCSMFSALSEMDLSDAESSGTDDSYGPDDAPRTPDTVRTSEDMNIDPRLFS